MKTNFILDRLHDEGYEAYIVGGAVRDFILGNKNPHDIDIVTSAIPDEVEEVFRNETTVPLGKRFGVIIVNGTEVATYRRDRYHGWNNKDVEVTFPVTLEEDLSRRDFTINAMAYDVNKKEVIDLYNGLFDLEHKVIRFVGDPSERIFEDPNRMIRACRFVTKIDGIIEKNSWDALISHSDSIETFVSPERIRLEVLKTMQIRKASNFFRTLHQIRALQYIFPSLEDCVDHPHGPHHLEDVFEHNMICGDCISVRYPLLKLATYLHDVGKPAACKINPRTNDLTFVGHVETGSNLVRDELGALKFSNIEINYISKLIYLHMRDIGSNHKKAIRRVLRELNEANIEYKDLLRMLLADKRGNLKRHPYSIQGAKTLVGSIEEVISEKPPNRFEDLVLNGNDIMEITGFSPNLIIGKILNFLLDKVTDEPELNTKEKLTKLVKEYNDGKYT